jgi:hypothetical protein
MPGAESGDKVAQTYVGEIYERGLGTAPDYAKAALWYQKAADQGYARAAINLGFLYEQGLGVPKDPAKALALYRKAAGIEGSINLDGAPQASSKEELDALRRDLDRTRQDLEKARRELDQQRLKSSQEIERLTQQKLAASAAGNAEETRRLEARLTEREAELEKSRQLVARMQRASDDQRAKLAALEGESATLRKELEQAQQQLAQSQREVDAKRTAAAEAERRLSATQQDLARQKSAATPPDPARVKALETELEKNRAEYARQQQEIARLQASADRANEDYKARLARLEGESAVLRKELDDAKRQLAQSQRDVDERKAAAADAERRVAAMQQELTAQKGAAAANPARIQALEADLEKTRAEASRQRQEVAKLEADVAGYRDKVAKLESAPPKPAQNVSMAAPSIQIIDPPVVVTRDSATVTVRGGVSSRPVVGRVTAPAGLLSFTANDIPVELDAEGMFKTTANLAAGRTRMTFVAVDRQGKRNAVEFFMEPDAKAAAAVVAATPKMSGRDLGLGKYYALLIGNWNYPKLPKLNTPESDVTVIGGILKDRYGFDVTILVNATRVQMLNELNRLQKGLTENDSLLVYYAGHGEYDRKNNLSSWLPIDAEADNDANWIESSRLSEKLNTFQARHILVVADSCYAGSMTRSSIAQVPPGQDDKERFAFLKSLAKDPSRTVLTSGGVSPVMDGGGGKHSVFAQNFIDALVENSDILLGRQLSDAIAARVVNEARRLNFDQRPEYGPIRHAGHLGGDFLFVPTRG